jgi:FG-GAP-like repeat
MSRFRLVVFVVVLFVLVGTSAISSAQQAISPFFFGLDMGQGMIGTEPWPVDNFSSARLWDSGTVSWADINTAPGVYDWRQLNIWMNHASQNGVDLLYCFGRTPTWASSRPHDKSCANEVGSCDAPEDLNPDGTGTDLDWKNFVRAIAEHSAGRIHYWELWDEFPNPYRWDWNTKKGERPNTVQQLVRMESDAYTIIKEVDPTAVIVGDSAGIRYAPDVTKITEFVQAGGYKYADVIAFHGYTQPAGAGLPEPETLVGLLDGSTLLPWGAEGFIGFLNSNGYSGVPLWDTEGSWAAVAAGFHNPDEQAGFAVRFNIIHQSLGVQRFYWYSWDNVTSGTLWLYTTRFDLALPNSNGNVSTMLGFGDGSFQQAVDHGAGSNPVAAAVGDFNNQGIADIVVANQGSNDVSVLIGNGNGTFEPGLNSAAGDSPVAVAVGDFNQDNNLDVVVANGGSSNTVSVLLGKGTGYFDSPTSYPVGTNPVSVAVGDFNQDGYPDIAVANAGSGNVTVLLNNGKSGGFTGKNYPVGNGPSSVAVGNFVTTSKYPDLVVTNATDGTVSVLLNNGNGTFGTQTTYQVGTSPSAVATGAFTGQSQLIDLAVANAGSNNVSVLLGNGSGAFATAVNYNVGTQPVGIALGYINGTAALDIVTANEGDNTVSTLFGTTTKGKQGTFTQPMNTNVGSSPVALALGAFSVIGTHDPGTVLKGGFGYQASWDWTVGNTLTAPCNGVPYGQHGVWTCDYTGPNGYEAQAVWDSSQSCANNVCTTSQYTVPSQYTQYRTAYCQVLPVQKGTVNIGYIPIFLENKNGPNPYCPNPSN